MQFIPGTHKVEQLPHLDTFHRDNLLSRGQEIAVEVDTSKAVGIGLARRRDVVAPHQAGARLGAEPQRRPAHRLRDPLHPDLRAPDQGARLGDAGPRHRQVRPLRERAAAARRPRSRRRWRRTPSRSSARSRRCTRAPTSRSSAPEPAARRAQKARPTMTPEQILAIPPRVLTSAQREFYFRRATCCSSGSSATNGSGKLRAATDELVERSRKVTRSDAAFDLEPDHRPERAAPAPRAQPDRAPSGVLGLRNDVGPAATPSPTSSART